MGLGKLPVSFPEQISQRKKSFDNLDKNGVNHDKAHLMHFIFPVTSSSEKHSKPVSSECRSTVCCGKKDIDNPDDLGERTISEKFTKTSILFLQRNDSLKSHTYKKTVNSVQVCLPYVPRIEQKSNEKGYTYGHKLIDNDIHCNKRESNMKYTQKENKEYMYSNVDAENHKTEKGWLLIIFMSYHVEMYSHYLCGITCSSRACFSGTWLLAYC